MTIAVLAHPEWFSAIVWIVVVVAAAVALAAWRGRRRRRVLMGTGRPAVARKWTSDTALLIALAAVGAALLGPRIGQHLVAMNADGVDLVILVDVSRSMDATDNPPSRLDRARRGIEEILTRLESNDRVALAAFAGRGVLLAPLTPDHAALEELARALDTDLIQPASSELDAGLRAAVSGFETGSQRPRVVALFSDGEDPRHTEPFGIAAVRGAEARVVSIAFGSETGSAIPAGDVPLRDRGGQVIVSRRRTQRLERLAEATDGAILTADRWGEFDFDAATALIRREAADVAGERVERRVAAVRVAPFAALALALLFAEGLPRFRVLGRGRRPQTNSRRLRAPLATAGALGASMILSASTPAPAEPTTASRADVPAPEVIEAQLRGQPRDARTLYALGRSRLAHGDADRAAVAFAAAGSYARRPGIASSSYFALGVSELERGELERARDAFFDALAFDPHDTRTRFNLEWTLLALDRRPPDPEPEPERPKPPEPDRSKPTPDRETPEPDASEPEIPLEADSADPDPTPVLSDAQRQRALARVSDDLKRAVRAAARADTTGRRDSGPAW